MLFLTFLLVSCAVFISADIVLVNIKVQKVLCIDSAISMNRHVTNLFVDTNNQFRPLSAKAMLLYVLVLKN